MKISIITVSFNSESTIEDTIKSVLSQTYADIEYIIVDGVSQDSTNNIVERYSNSVDVHVVEKDEGLYDAMNKGVLLATGDVIGILNSDDIYNDKYVIEKLVSNFSDEVDAIYADLVIVDKDDTTKVVRYYSSSMYHKKLIRFGIMLPHPTFFVRKSFYDKYGLYDNSFPVAADFDLITRFVNAGVRLKRLDAVLVRMRNGGKSNNSFFDRISQNFEIIRACKKNRIYSNFLFLLVKLPYKLSSYFMYRIFK